LTLALELEFELFLEVTDRNQNEMIQLKKEGEELLAIIVASIRTARKNKK